MKPGDILEYRCPRFSIVWQWRVLSICHGADRQEGLIEVKPLMAGDGFAHGKRMESVWVPEPMTRGLALVEATHDPATDLIRAAAAALRKDEEPK